MAATYQPQTPLPARLVREVATLSELPVYVDSTLTAPGSGTYTLTRPDGTKAVDAQNVTITSSVATYTVTLAATEAVGNGWQETWVLTFGSTPRTFYRDAGCVLRAYPCVISTADCLQRHPELANQYPQGDSNAEKFVDEAQITVGLWLLQQGKDPWLVVSPYSFREPQLLLALCYWFRALATYAGDVSRFQSYADKYEKDAMTALTNMRLTYDENQDNIPGISEEGQGAGAVLFLSSPPAGGFQSTGRRWWRGVP